MRAGDPFERASKIRNGELDDEMPSYWEMCGWFQRVSISKLPGLLVRVVEMCVRRKVFVDNDALLKVVNRAIARGENPTGSILREDHEE